MQFFILHQMKYLHLIFFIVLINFSSTAQNRLRISLLTCTPGEELYATFGHSALRVIDSNAVTDIVYNYGTFDFSDKDFYIKFVRGKLLYCLSVEEFQNFKAQYIFENRGITEQVLTLTEEESAALRHALNENLKEENRFYNYDFFLDNCTTRLRDIIEKIKKPVPLLPSVMPTIYTFRNAIHQYLNANKNYWSKLGIDLLLGARTDAVMTPRQQQFLPDNLMFAIDSCTNIQLVQAKASVYAPENFLRSSIAITPMMASIIISVLVMALSFSKRLALKKIYSGFKFLLFFLIGMLGILLLFMWWGTDHSMTKNNYNLIWALPTHAVFAFFVYSKKSFVKKYFYASFFVNILLLISWAFLPQQLNIALIPLVATMAFISFSSAKQLNLSNSNA